MFSWMDLFLVIEKSAFCKPNNDLYEKTWQNFFDLCNLC